jgi:hypothetical protein
MIQLSLNGCVSKIVRRILDAIFATTTLVFRTVMGAASESHESIAMSEKCDDARTSGTLNNSQTANCKERCY